MVEICNDCPNNESCCLRAGPVAELRAELERLRAENSKAIAEVGRIGRELGRAQAEADRLRALLADIKEWDINRDGGKLFAVPYELRQRIQREVQSTIDAARGE